MATIVPLRDTDSPVCQALQTMFQPGDVFEIRVLGAVRGTWGNHVESGYFSFERANEVQPCLNELKTYMGAYVTMNPVMPALLARADHKIVPKPAATTGDAEILCRRWLLIDIDPDRPAGISATEDEKLLAQEVAADCLDWLNERGWPDPLTVDSGNGLYLMYRIDLPADDSGLVKRILQTLAQRFNTDKAKVDTSVYNAARIARVPGTWNRKGDSLTERPHRLAEVVDCPGALECVSVEALHTLAAEMPATPARTPAVSIDGDRPGDDFCQRGEIEPILARHGWVNESGDRWRRPSKNFGTSATYDGNVFYVFSSNAAPFEANRGYSRFQVYAMLEHGGDWSAAARALESQGYGHNMPQVDLSRIVKPRAQKPQEQPFPEHLLNVPGFIGDVMEFNLATAPKPQPVLALAGAIALQAVLCARKITDRHRTMPNVFICSVADSGAGKNHAREINMQILIAADAGRLQAEGFKSGSAILTALEEQPALMFQVDEYGRFIRTTNNKQNPHAADAVSKLLILHSNSKGTYETEHYADAKRGGHQIHNPCAILHSTTVPRSLYDGLTQESVEDGFLARTLVFDIGDSNPKRILRDWQPPPEEIVNQARWWHQFNPGGNLNQINPEMVVIPTDDSAMTVFREVVEIEATEQEAIKGHPMQTLWSRIGENTHKLALIYAASRDCLNPVIDRKAAQWGCDLAVYLTRRMIVTVTDNVAENPFHAECQKVIRILKRNGGSAQRQMLLKRMKCRAKDLDEVLGYMVASGDLIVTETGTGRDMSYVYQLP